MALSGGVDSSTLLAYLLDKGNSVECVSFRYGSKHNGYENIAAREIAHHYSIKFSLIDLSIAMQGFQSNLLKSGGEIPEGHYTHKSMSQTVVPGRNIIFLSILAGLAWSIGAEKIAIGIHQGDHAMYPDCRIGFYAAMDKAIQLGTGHNVSIEAPFIEWNKQAIVTWGLLMHVPYNLTRTCYKDQKIACGKCGACVERLEAFELSLTIDPIEYAK